MKNKFILFIVYLGIAVLINSIYLRRSVELTIDNPNNYAGQIQFFWDYGYGFSESNSKSRTIRPGLNKYWFNFPLFYPKNLRFDVFEKPDMKFKIEKISLLYKHENELTFQKESYGTDQIKIKDGFYITTKNDPKIEIKNIPKPFVFFNSSFILVSFLFSLVLFFTPTKVYVKGLDFILSLAKKITFKINLHFNKYFKKNQFKASIILIFFASLLALYPVVFFNKSIDSPMSQALLSSPNSINPTIPGFDRENSHSESFRGNDTGAFDWGVGPNLIAGMHSIFHDGEFPFYNKYVGGGIANFAQLNNILLDPLNILIFIFDGNSLGFDLKLIFSRFIFALGIFFLISSISTSKATPIVLSISSLFIGYFHYRVQHPSVYTLTYAPLLLFSWIKFKNNIETLLSKKLLYLSFIAIFSFLVLNSGPAKEAAITVMMLSFYGAFNILFDKNITIRTLKIRLFYISLISIFILGVCVFDIALFLDYLSKNYSNYDGASADRYPLAYSLGFFQKELLRYTMGFSTNLFFYFLLILIAYNFRGLIRQKGFILPLIFFVISLSIAYTVIPNFIILKIPFVNNVYHLYDVFTIPAFLFFLVIASYAIDYLYKINFAGLKRISLLMLVIYVFFGALYIYHEHHVYHTITRQSIVVLLSTSFAFLFINLQKNKKAITKWLFALFFVHMFFNCFHLKSFKILDDYLTEPMNRADYSIPSEAINFIRNDQTNESFRVIGFEDSHPSTTLFPGFNTRYLIEGVVQVDPLRNKNFENFLELGGLKYVNDWHWLRLLNNQNTSTTSNLLNKLNVKYIFTNNYVNLDRTKYDIVHTSDYTVWLNKGYWPRAFSTNKVYTFKSDKELENLIKMESEPFVFLERDNVVQFFDFRKGDSSINYAHNYFSTNNSLGFSIRSNAGEILVINQNYYKKDYKLILNDHECDYFRINYYQIGCLITKDGLYNVTLTYHPEFALLSGSISVFFILICFLILIYSITIFFKKNGLNFHIISKNK